MKNSMHRSSRHGSLIVIVIVALVVVSAVTLNVVLRTVRAQAVQQQQLQRTQLRLLAESALDHGLQRITIDGSYQGETWDIPEDEWSLPCQGLAEVTLPEASSPASELRVQARLVKNDRVLQRLTISTPIHPSPQGENTP